MCFQWSMIVRKWTCVLNQPKFPGSHYGPALKQSTMYSNVMKLLVRITRAESDKNNFLSGRLSGSTPGHYHNVGFYIQRLTRGGLQKWKMLWPVEDNDPIHTHPIKWSHYLLSRIIFVLSTLCLIHPSTV